MNASLCFDLSCWPSSGRLYVCLVCAAYGSTDMAGTVHMVEIVVMKIKYHNSYISLWLRHS